MCLFFYLYKNLFDFSAVLPGGRKKVVKPLSDNTLSHFEKFFTAFSFFVLSGDNLNKTIEGPSRCCVGNVTRGTTIKYLFGFISIVLNVKRNGFPIGLTFGSTHNQLICMQNKRMRGNSISNGNR